MHIRVSTMWTINLPVLILVGFISLWMLQSPTVLCCCDGSWSFHLLSVYAGKMSELVPLLAAPPTFVQFGNHVLCDDVYSCLQWCILRPFAATAFAFGTCCDGKVQGHSPLFQTKLLWEFRVWDTDHGLIPLFFSNIQCNKTRSVIQRLWYEVESSAAMKGQCFCASVAREPSNLCMLCRFQMGWQDLY